MGDMDDTLAKMLAVGGKSNSLGKVNDVIAIALKDRRRLSELYSCLFDEDAWVRMRAADALEKICRVHPDWLLPYIDRFSKELADSTQPSIQWHMAQIYRQVALTEMQKTRAITWLKKLLSTEEVDWIVSANAMDTLAQFVDDGSVVASELIALLDVQLRHTSKTVTKRANTLLEKYKN